MGTVVPIRSRTSNEQSRDKRPRNEGKSARHIHFTPQRIEALTRAGSQGYFYDTRTPGLAVRLGKSKAVYVQALRAGGAYQRHTLGNVASMLLADARAAVTAAAGARAKGEALPAPRQARKAARDARAAERERNALTLAVAFELFLCDRELKPKTAKTYRDCWQHVPAAVRATPFANVDADAVTSLHKSLGRKGKKRTANKLIGVLRVVFNKSGRSADNPARDIELYREVPRSRRLSVGEADRLRAVLADELRYEDLGRAMTATFVTMAYLTGARRSSLLAMRWADLDLREGQAVWVVPARWSKTSVELALALVDEAVTVLAAWRERCPVSQWVFPSPTSASGHIEEPKKGWAKIRRAAGIGDVMLHDLRRSLGSEVAANGGNAATIAGVLGHMSLQSAKAYVHLNTTETRAALERARGKRDA